MSDTGKYLQLWKKYMPVIRLLLKKSGDQKLQLYKHDFETSGVKNKAGYLFNIEMVNGKVMNRISSSAIACDLVQSMNEMPAVNEWLKANSLQISMGRSYEVIFTKTTAAIEVESEAPSAEQQSSETEA